MFLKVFFHAMTAGGLLAISACGGGGGGDSDGAGGLSSSGTAYNEVTVINSILTAGDSTSMKAYTAMRMTTPKTMMWSVMPVSSPNPATDPAPVISDPECKLASYSAAISTTTPGEGLCAVVLKVPNDAKTGVWRITNIATDGQSVTASKFVDIAITSLPSSSFKLIESSIPISGYQNQLLNLSILYTANQGSNISNVKYQWTASTANPSNDLIAGSTNSYATVTPTAHGQYKYDLTVTADVDGRTEQRNGTVVAMIKSELWPDVITAGDAQIVSSGSIVKLIGGITNQDKALAYTTEWKQLTGASGGPAAVILANSTSNASFVPTVAGTYGFEYVVTKTKTSGEQLTTRAQTAVIVQSQTVPVFSVSGGNAVNVATNSPTQLVASVSGQAGPGSAVGYTYQWSQVGRLPVAVALSNATSSTASFIPTVPGTYMFDVTVTAGSGANAVTAKGSTQVNVRVGP